MTEWREALGELTRRRGRSLLTLLSVVIAVSAIVAVASATATTRKAYNQVFEALAGRADLEIVARGGDRFQQKIADKISEVPGVRDVVPVLHRATQIWAHGSKAKVLAVGIVADKPESLEGYELVEGHFPKATGEIAVETQLARNLKVTADENANLLTARLVRQHKVTGIFKLKSAARLHEGGMLLAPVSRLQSLFRTPGAIDSLHVYLNDPDQADKVTAAISQVIPQELKVGVPASRSGLAEETLLLTNVSLNLASALSFTTAVFIALSVFLMNVGERRRQLALLRALGATRRQVVALVCREAFVMGLAGTLLGIPLGVYGGGFLIRQMSAMLNASLPPVPDLGWAVGTGLLFGPTICLLAAWYPAHKASRVSPLEGMRPVVTMGSQKSHRTTTITGVVGLVVTFILAIFCLRGDVPIWSAIVGLILSLVSLTLLMPALLPAALALLAWPMGKHPPVEAEMSKRLVLRHGGRSALTIAVLFIAVAAGVGTSNAVFSITDDIRTWYDRTITADFLLRTSMPDMTGQDATSINESFRDEIAGFDGVERVEGVRLLRVEAGGQDGMIVSRDFDLYNQVPLDIVQGDSDHMLKHLHDGEIVLGSVLAARIGAKQGDMLPIVFGDQSHTFRVAGIATEYSFGGAVVYLDRSVAQRIFGVEGVDSFLIKANPAKQAALETRLRSLAGENGLLLQSFAELLKLIDSMVAGVTGGLWVILALGLLIGALGVVNTLTMNVLEQTRELGMLQAIGMRKRQIVGTVLGQAGFIGLLGVLTGGIAGLSLARSINICLGSMFGHHVPFAMRPQFFLLLIGVALGVVMLSALFPARRAAALNPIQAMRAE